MVFSSSIFIFIFLPFVLFFYYIILKKRNIRNVFLLLVSLGFYAWGEPLFVSIMILSIIANYIFGLLIDKYRASKRNSTLILVLMLVFNLGIMFIFKYLVFTINNINSIFLLNISLPHIVLPIGISFFTFQAISYVIDVYRGHGSAQKNPLNVGLYISIFPQLIAGPIVRYETIADQITNRRETFDDISKGVCIFISGLSKKVLIANTLALVADKAFSLNGNELSVCFSWLGAIAYTFQIYFDFSGYSDMAIGLGKMFGFQFEKNFDYPYISKSISEFWRRWHISLGTWFRDYVYFPLGGSRVNSKSRLVLNLFIVWSLTGLWHGANWTFIIWGIFYFILITVEKLVDFDKRLINFNWAKHVYAMLAVVFGWVLFRSENIANAVDYMGCMFGLKGNAILDNLGMLYLSENIYILFFAAIFSMPVAKWIDYKFKLSQKTTTILNPIVYILIFMITVSYIVKGTHNPFIYFNF